MAPQATTTLERNHTRRESTQRADARMAGRFDGLAVTVAPSGRLEHVHYGDASHRAITLLSVVPGADITVDLHAVPIIDETSAQLIADAQSRTRRNGGRFTVLRARSQPREALLAFGVRSERPATLPARATPAGGEVVPFARDQWEGGGWSR